MTVTLAESAVISTNQLARGIIETFIQESPILDRIPFIEIQGNAYAFNSEGTLPTVAYRAVNEAYPESTGTFKQTTESLYILGGDADLDNFIQQTRSNLNDQRAEQTVMKVKALSYAYQDSFFNGDNDTNNKSFNGLKKRLTGKQVLDADTNGLRILGDGKEDIFKFFDKLDELCASVNGLNGSNGALYTNAAIIAKIRSAARHVSADVFVQNDVAGKRSVMWNGIPILDAGSTPAGEAVLGLDETQGTASNTGSIYAVRFAQGEGDTGIIGLTNGGVMVKDLGELQEKPSKRTRIEFYTGLALFGAKGAARLKGVINA